MVHWTDLKEGPKSEEYDNVLFAIGRSPEIKDLGLEEIGVTLNKSSKKIVTDIEDRSTVKNIFAIGDIAHGRLELTPTAIMVFKSH